MKLSEIDAWSVLGKLVAYGAVAILGYRIVFPDTVQHYQPAPIRQAGPEVPVAPVVQPHPRVSVDEHVPADSSGWDWTSGGEETSQYGETQEDGLPMNQGILMTNVLLGPPAAVEAVGDVPADIVEALLNEVSGPKNQAFLAAMSWKETRHNNKAVRKQSGDDGGQSKGPWQVHSYWAKRTAQHAEDYGQPELADAIRKGISEDIVSNLRGVRALLEIQGQWRDDGGYHSIASYYNEGASWHKAKGQRYADDVMKKYAEYLPLFEAL